jgi:RND family efflux transporter MFP subunit
LKRRLLPLVAAGLVVAGAGAFARRLLTPLEVRAAAVARGPALATVFATGWIEPCERRLLRPARPAIVARIFKREGDEARAGEPLVELRDTAREQREERVRAELDRIAADLAEGSALRSGAQARIQEATVAEEWAAEEVERMKPLLDQQLLDRRAYDQLEMNRRMAAERRRGAEQELAETLGRLGTEQRQYSAELEMLHANTRDDRILAPFDGVVLLRFAEEGESVNPERDLLKFGDLRELRIEGDVDEDDVARVAPGQRVLVRLAGDAATDERDKLQGEVSELFPDGNRATRSFRVRVRFRDATFVPDGPLGLRGRLRAGSREIVAGTSVELGIVVEEKADALVVPRAALTARGTVYVLADGRAHERDVAVGVRNFDRCEVVRGLEAGELVAIEQLAELSDGRRAVAKPLAPPAAAPPRAAGSGSASPPGAGR